MKSIKYIYKTGNGHGTDSVIKKCFKEKMIKAAERFINLPAAFYFTYM